MATTTLRSFKLPKPVDRALIAEADRRNTTRTAVVVEALVAHLDTEVIQATRQEPRPIEELVVRL